MGAVVMSFRWLVFGEFDGYGKVPDLIELGSWRCTLVNYQPW